MPPAVTLQPGAAVTGVSTAVVVGFVAGAGATPVVGGGLAGFEVAGRRLRSAPPHAHAASTALNDPIQAHVRSDAAMSCEHSIIAPGQAKAP